MQNNHTKYCFRDMSSSSAVLRFRHMLEDRQHHKTWPRQGLGEGKKWKKIPSLFFASCVTVSFVAIIFFHVAQNSSLTINKIWTLLPVPSLLIGTKTLPISVPRYWHCFCTRNSLEKIWIVRLLNQFILIILIKTKKIE